jgi:hypothetical protein
MEKIKFLQRDSIIISASFQDVNLSPNLLQNKPCMSAEMAT